MPTFKPFKAPTVVRCPSQNDVQSISEPPKKRRRTSSAFENDDNGTATAAAVAVLGQHQTLDKKFKAPQREPLGVVGKPGRPSSSFAQDENEIEAYYGVLWRKFTTKKNKTWDSDGVLSISNGYATLQDVSGKILGKTVCNGPLLIGSALSMSGKDVEVESTMSKEEYLAGRTFLAHAKKLPLPKSKTSNQTERKNNTGQMLRQKLLVSRDGKPDPSTPTPKAAHGTFKVPLLNDIAQVQTYAKAGAPRHDPNQCGALVMRRPHCVPKGKRVVDVVVDPLLTKHLREHQRAGVAFMYECVMGMKDYSGEGAILADEMGLGKTLQTIALLWTLLKQNPICDESPVIKKALIVCPVTLISNWRKEFRKWLGNERIGVFIADNKNARLTDFTMGKSYSVMIIGYEKLRMVQDDLQKGAGIDIVIADEGHRLKSVQNKSALAIKSLNTERRIILSGTPLQNDLAEFYAMVDFVNPGLLNKYSVFKREFETPILKSQQPGASKKDLEKGEARSAELANITSMFILRRTAEILAKYLPPKTEYVLFCNPTKAQATVYRAIISSPKFSAALGSSAISLELINILKKVCNSPPLLLRNDNKNEENAKAAFLEGIPPSQLKSQGSSGKLQVLDSLLHQIRTFSDEKVVIVSNYTSTMDVLGQLLTSLSYTFLRLDGSTPASKRQDLVDRFNSSSPIDCFAFLLSAKAGGTGLNLIGASRLILFDLDWNPATDLQAMARVHRDGQKRPCYIYRLLLQGALDEKIFQRQVSKTGLADSIVDGKSGVSGFSREELRDLFTLDESNACQTHELLNCNCGGRGAPVGLSNNEAIDMSRNDLARLSEEEDPDRSEEGVEVVRLDQDDELPTVLRTQWKKANEYDWRAEEAEFQQKVGKCRDSTGKAKMLSLMQYTHLDSAFVDKASCRHEAAHVDESEDYSMDADPLEGAIEDFALRKVLREDGRRIGFVFAKLSA